MSQRQTIVSAPGKVLLAGGYLVLDRAYTGLVVATSSRFYASVSDVPAGAASVPTSSFPSASTSVAATPAGSGRATPQRVKSARVSVTAGQFPKDASTWAYDVVFAGENAPKLVPAHEARNKFVEVTLSNVLLYAGERLGRDGLARKLGAGLDVVVLANNDFYSQREQLAAANLPPRLESLAALEPFCPLPRPIGNTNKTGLGSSAALVTSLVAALLQHLGLADVASAADRDEIHSLAQAAHCLAQGKVGSGFDVASAVYGTHVYRRFSPSVLEPLFNGTGSVLSVVRSDAWDTEQRPFRLPRGLRMMLADVDAGTDTPSFVGKVLAWRKDKPEEAKKLWDRVDESNRELEACLAALVDAEKEPSYDQVIAEAASRPITELSDGKVEALLKRTRDAILRVRAGMQAMSSASGVAIEPVEQTRLLDTCSACPGVLGGGVPGAGGYDAVWVLALDAKAPVASVETVWGGWSEMSVCPLSARQSDGGLQLEMSQAVPGLAARLSPA
ncbi:phosphomevalonate kinase [Apiotrichum porosum]|uniref:Phosphomevalonate kinase n=1 Tax=Apiotrichum porosum TaxID=105984 RepID=A0A427XF57_9TREE|nr:phosphomevalonate kinase [Apiotrichum porosum]RSH77383.1 phosphomevalonate kinase [Apiotrichum porosum]